MTPTTAPAPAPARRDPTSLRAIDVDLHPPLPDWAVLAPYAPAGLRHRLTRQGGPPLARHSFTPVGARYGSAPVPAAGQPADAAWVKAEYLDRRGVDLAILSAATTSLSAQPNADLAAALATALNDWVLDAWVRPYSCFKGSILVAPQDPAQAVAEIDRLAGEPGMVQVILGSGTETPLGRRAYHPIYAACARHNLPLALHCGGEGAGLTPPATAVGHPSTYLEWYASLPQTYMAHLVSLVTEGVFARYPTLKVVLYEGGILWLPHLLWRFDKNWKAQRAETPWVTAPPSATLLAHCALTTYPLEAFPTPTALHQALALIAAERTLLFASNYPAWTVGDPFAMVADVPEPLRRRVLVENALALYGDRLLLA